MPDNLKELMELKNKRSIGNITPNSVNSEDVNVSNDVVPQTNFLLQTNINPRLPGVTDVTEYNKYGVYPTTFFDYELARAKAQPWAQQLGNAIVQSGTTAIGEFVSGVGSVPGVIEATVDEIAGGNADFNNAIMEFGNSIQEFGRDIAPIYRQHPNKAFDISDFGWWASNAPSIASSIGLLFAGQLVTSGITKSMSAISKASRAANIAGKGNKLTKVLSQYSKTGDFYTRLATNATIMRNGENLKESAMLYNQMKDEVLNYSDDDIIKLRSDDQFREQYRNDMGKNPDSKLEIAEYIAAKAGWRNYAVDAGNVIFDAIQIAPLLRGFRSNTRTLLNPSSVVNANRKAAGLSTMSKAASTFNNFKYVAGTMGFETITEGIEEAINNIASKEGLHYGRFIAGKEKNSSFGTRLSEYIKDPHLWEEAMWGSIGGAVFSGGTRALRNVQNMISDIKDPRSSKSRIEEIHRREVGITAMVGMMKQVDEGINPLASATEDNTIRDADHAAEIKQRIIEDASDTLGINAAQRGNTNLYLDQLNTPEYREQLLKINDNPQEVDNVLNTLKEGAIEAEQAYSDLYSHITNNGNIKDYLKDIIISDGMTLHNNKKRYTKLMNEYSAAVSEDLLRPTTQAVRDSFNEENKDNTGVDFDSALNKSALQKLRTDINRLIAKEPTINDNPVLQRRFNKLVEEVNNRITELDTNPGYNTMAPLVGEQLISNLSNKLGNEMLLNGVNAEFSELVANPEKRAEEVDNQLSADTEVMFAKYSDNIKDSIKKAKSYKDLSEIERKLKRDKRKYSGYKELEAQLNTLINDIQAKKATVEAEYRRRKLAGEKGITSETVVEIVDDTAEAVVDGKPTPSFTGNPVETKDEPVDTPTDKEQDEESEAPDIKVNENDYDYLNFVPTELSVFNSAIHNMGVTLNEDGTIKLTEEQAKIWDIVFNQTKVGTKLYIKYDEQQPDKIVDGVARKRPIYEKRLGVYDDSGNLLFHINELYATNYGISYSHAHMVYTPKTSWSRVFAYLMNKGQLNSELNAIFGYRLAKLTNNKQEINKNLSILMNSEIFNSIMNTNRSNKIDTDSTEFFEALDHIVNVVTNGIKANELRSTPNIEYLTSSIDKWSDTMQNELLTVLHIRNTLLDSENGILETNISSKTTGSFILNTNEDGEVQYGFIHDVVSENGDSNSVKLLGSQLDNPNKIIPINDAAFKPNDDGSIDMYDVQDGVVGIPHIGLKMANINNQSTYKYVRSQLTNLGMTNLPKSVLDYNNKLGQFIVDTIKDINDINKIYKVLRYYIRITKNKNDNYYTIYTANFNKSEGRVVYHLKYDEQSGDAILTRGNGKVNLIANDRLADTLREFKVKGLQRGIYMTPRSVNITGDNIKIAAIPSGKFVDKITNTEYPSYTSFLIETGGIVTQYGAVRDNNNKLISNGYINKQFHPGGTPLIIKIATNNLTTVSEQKPRTERVKTNSLHEFGSQLILNNPYANLFKLVDKLGINFDSSYREEFDGLALFDGSTNTIKLSTEFDNINLDGLHYGVQNRLLAHESIHKVINNNLQPDHITRLIAVHTLMKNKFNSKSINDMFTSDELISLNIMMQEISSNISELITYGLTNPTMAKFLNSIEMEVNNEPKSLARELIDIILDVIEQVFGKTALTEVSNILDEIINNDNKPTQNNDINTIMDMYSKTSDVYIDRTVPNAIEYIRSLDKESRQIVRNRINNGTLTFKC